MRKWVLAAALPVAIAGVTLGTLSAQGRGSGSEAPEAGPEAGSIDGTAPASAQGLEAWRRDLGQADLAQRERAFERAVRAARRDGELLDALKRWSDEGGELGWTSRLVLREAERAAPFDLETWMPGSGADLDAWMESLRRGDLEGFFAQPGWPRRHGFQPPAAPGARRELDQFSMKVTPEGVEATVTREVDGEPVTETYQAASIEELLQAHPELAEKISVGPLGGMDFHLSPGGPLGVPWSDLDLGRGLQGRFGFPRTWQGPGWVTGEVRTDVLGVAVREPSEAEAADRGVEPGIGLYVERVERRTMAEGMGLRPGDLLLEINGREIRSRADVAAALAERAPRGEVRVELVEPGGENRTRTWRPGLEALRQL